jgi:TetR/AcrR family transcriptional regulator, cholesterol catabolism regulator
MLTPLDTSSDPAPSMREQLRSFKKERILAVAQKLFFERGFRGTSLEAIADAMDVTKPFVYGIYDKKTDILFELVSRSTTLALGVVEEALKSEGTPSARLAQVARGLTTVCIEHQEAVTIFYREENALDPEHHQIINERKGAFDAGLAALLTEGVESGEFEVDDVRTAALAIGGMLSWTYSWFRPTGRLSMEELVEHMTQYALRIAGARSPARPRRK